MRKPSDPSPCYRHLSPCLSSHASKLKEEVFWKRFAFKPELKKVIAHFKDLDYQLEIVVKQSNCAQGRRSPHHAGEQTSPAALQHGTPCAVVALVS